MAILWLTSVDAGAQVGKQMKLITGGTRIMGAGYQYVIDGHRMHLATPDVDYADINSKTPAIGELPEFNGVERQVTVSDFYLSDHEVTNLEYRTFLLDSLLKGKEHADFLKALKSASKDPKAAQAQWEKLQSLAAERQLLPNLTCWKDDFAFAYNDPLVKHYFSHPAFDQYPVVGVSWEQANTYCKWLSHANNAARANKGLPPQADFRLPTEMEWEYAALGPVTLSADNIPVERLFPWEGNTPRDRQGAYLANIKPGNGDYISDNYEYTAAVKSFPPNGFGLHEMAGNVSEWTMDSFILQREIEQGELVGVRRPDYRDEEGEETAEKPSLRVIKGGSWADYQYAAYCGSRAGLDASKGYSRVGFRVAMTKLSDDL